MVSPSTLSANFSKYNAYANLCVPVIKVCSNGGATYTLLCINKVC